MSALSQVREGFAAVEADAAAKEQALKNLERWLTGFDRVETGVAESVKVIRDHPLLPKDIPVHGLIMHPETGKLNVLVDGYKKEPRD